MGGFRGAHLNPVGLCIMTSHIEYYECLPILWTAQSRGPGSEGRAPLFDPMAGGSIVMVSALGGGLTGLGRAGSAYGMSKGGVVSLTRDLAAEWKGVVRVNAVRFAPHGACDSIMLPAFGVN